MMGLLLLFIGLFCLMGGLYALNNASKKAQPASPLLSNYDASDPAPYFFRALALMVVGAILVFVGVTW